jgi:DedD protein
VPKGLTSWVVQVAALGTPEAAQRLERDLRGKGFHAFVEKLAGPNRTLWRVRVGPEIERTRADALATDVKRRTGLDAYVQKYGGG